MNTDGWLSVGMRMVAWGLNIRELHLAIVGRKGRRRQRRKTSAGILIFIAEVARMTRWSLLITTDRTTDRLDQIKYQQAGSHLPFSHSAVDGSRERENHDLMRMLYLTLLIARSFVSICSSSNSAFLLAIGPPPEIGILLRSA